MPAQIQIDQATLAPPGVAGVSRSDGLDGGQLVTLTSTGGGSTHRFEILWLPDQDSTALGTLVQTGTPNIWTFSPTAGVYGSYRIRLIVDEGLATEDESIRIFAIRLPTSQLRIPALNEDADVRASVVNSGPPFIEASQDNEPDPGSLRLSGGSYAGWYRAQRELYEYVETLGAGAVSVREASKIVVGNQPAGDTANDCDFLDLGDGQQLRAACAAASSVNGAVVLKPGTYNFELAGPGAGKITIPDNVRVYGQGIGHTRIRTNIQNDQGAFVFGDLSSLENVTVEFGFPGGLGTPGADMIMDMAGIDCSVRDVMFSFPGFYTGVEAGLMTVSRIFAFRNGTGGNVAYVSRCFNDPNTLVPFTGLLGGNTFRIVETETGHNNLVTLENLDFLGADESMQFGTPTFCRRVNVLGNDLGARVQNHNGSEFEACNVQFLSAATIGRAYSLESATECTITGGRLGYAIAGNAGTGVFVDGNSERNKVGLVTARNLTTFLEYQVGAVDNTAGLNHRTNSTNGIIDPNAPGANTDIGNR